MNDSGKEGIGSRTSSPPTVDDNDDVQQPISRNVYVSVTISHQDGSMLGVAYSGSFDLSSLLPTYSPTCEIVWWTSSSPAGKGEEV